jgi:hypothetical protein
MGPESSNTLGGLVNLLDECTSLIDVEETVGIKQTPSLSESLPSLLDQCRELTSAESVRAEPIRTIHHFACTGGTLFSKCIASMPNTQLLSEVAPHSHMDERRFCPTDLIQLLRASSRGSGSELEIEVFLAGLEALYRQCTKRGLRLVLRDHPHSIYCSDSAKEDSVCLYNIVSRQHRIVSVVTVRHPLDSYLSLVEHGWVTKRISNIELYVGAYSKFLDDHADLMRFKYEELVQDPEPIIKKMCEALELPFNPAFNELFHAHKLSGDSGRAGRAIEIRDRREIPGEILDQVRGSEIYIGLCERLGYPAD